MQTAPQPLDLARRAWLEGIARQHHAAPSATGALALARAEWMCGEYDDALVHFGEARDRDLGLAEAHVALVRALSMLARDEAEALALETARRLHPHDIDLILHAARSQVPDDLDAAWALLAGVVDAPLCAEFAAAIDAIRGEIPASAVMPLPVPSQAGVDGEAAARRRARWASLDWSMRHARDRSVHTGSPARVLLRALDAAPNDGLTLECGVYFGRSLRLIAERSAGLVHGFDSFEGLPEAWNEREGPGAYSTAGRLPRVRDNVRLHRGWFEDTLPPFFAAQVGPVRLLHIDCDLYSSTRTVLEQADARLVPGSVLVFDDLLGYPGFEAHELKAFAEFADSRAIGWELVAACLLGREVAIRITAR